MEYRAWDRRDLGLLLVRWRGRFDARTGIAFYGERLYADACRSGQPTLHDLRQVDFAVSTSEVRRAALACPVAAAAPPRRVATVVSDTLAFGMLRMMTVYRESGSDTLRQSVFRSVGEALAWLRRPEGAGRPALAPPGGRGQSAPASSPASARSISAIVSSTP